MIVILRLVPIVANGKTITLPARRVARLAAMHIALLTLQALLSTASIRTIFRASTLYPLKPIISPAIRRLHAMTSFSQDTRRI
jgi:hypothetical protein